MPLTSMAGYLLVVGLLAQAPDQVDQWSAVRSADGDFGALLPSRPNSKKQEVPTQAGKVEQEIHYCRVNGSLFTVQRIRLGSMIPGHQAAEWLAAQKRSYFVNGNKPAGERKIQRDGVSGEDFAYIGPAPDGKGTVTSRTQHYLRGRDYYSLTVMSARDAALPEEAGRFFDSFHLAGSASPPPSGSSLSPSGVATSPSGARVKVLDGTPEEALRTFVIAMALRDEPALRAITLPVKGFEWLMKGPATPPSLFKELQESLARQPIRNLKAGDTFTLPGGQVAAVKADDMGPDEAFLLPEGANRPTRLQRVKGHWKVDPSGMIAAQKSTGRSR